MWIKKMEETELMVNLNSNCFFTAYYIIIIICHITWYTGSQYPNKGLNPCLLHLGAWSLNH